MDKQLFGWLMMSVGLIVGTLLGLFASPVDQQGPDIVLVPRDSWTVEKPEPVPKSEPESLWEWDRPEVDLDDQEALLQEAECAIRILDMVGLELSVASVFALGDWSDMAYGGPCEHLEALTDGRSALAD